MADLQLHHLRPPQQLRQPEGPARAASGWEPADHLPLGGAPGYAPPPDTGAQQQPLIQPSSTCCPLPAQHHLPGPVQQQVGQTGNMMISAGKILLINTTALSSG